MNSDDISSTLSDCAILVVLRYYKNICCSFISYILSVREIEKSHARTHTHAHTKCFQEKNIDRNNYFFEDREKHYDFDLMSFLLYFFLFSPSHFFYFPVEKVYQQTFIPKIRCIVRLFRALLNAWISSSRRVETRGCFAAILFNVIILYIIRKFL